MDTRKLFIINVGGSSTKLAVSENGRIISDRGIRHPHNDLKVFGNLWDQLPYRMAAVKSYWDEQGLSLDTLSAIVSRGPAVKPLQSGVYRVDGRMMEDAKSRRYGNHPCALGCQIGLELSGGKIPVLTVDPPCVDEMIPAARYTGLPSIRRRSFFQTLSHKAAGRHLAEELGTTYEDLCLVICHLGSGISVASHRHGRVVDVTNGLDGDGPFGLDRPGTLPAADWMRFCLSGEYTRDQLHRILNGGGGLTAHLGTNSGIEVEQRISDGDAKAGEVYEAMAFHVSKAIGAAAAALGQRPDAICLTGGLAASELFTGMVKGWIGWIASVYVLSGENEMETLAERADTALLGREPILSYE